MRSSRPLTGCSATLALLLVGCGPDPDADSPSGVVQAADAVDAAAQESSLLAVVVRGLDVLRVGPDGLRPVLDRSSLLVSDFFAPSCVETARLPTNPNSLRVTLRACNGRLGLRGVTGELLYTFEAPAGGGLRVRVQLAGTGPLRIGGGRITALDTTALFRASAGIYTSTIERSVYTAVGARGQYLQRDVSLAAGAAPLRSTFSAGMCFTLDGEWRVRVGASEARARTLHVSINNYRRCGAMCPQPADPAVVVTDETPTDGGVSRFTMSFLGASVARWTSTIPNASGVVSLACTN